MRTNNKSQKKLREILENENLSVIEKIGEGSFGQIFSALEKDTNEVVAVKLMQLNQAKQRQSFHREIQFANKLKEAKNVMHFKKANLFTINDQLFGFMVMEKMDTDLIEYLLQNQRLNVEKTKKIFKKLCIAVNECHKRNTYHLDIKLDNVLLKVLPGMTSSMDIIERVELCDFGFATNERISDSKRSYGTVEYLPPEVNFKADTIHCDKVDVWSLGVSLFTLITGLFPFIYQNGCMLRNNIEQSIQRFCDDEQLVNLLNLIFNDDPTSRPSVQDILNHPWLADDKQKIMNENQVSSYIQSLSSKAKKNTTVIAKLKSKITKILH